MGGFNPISGLKTLAGKEADILFGNNESRQDNMVDPATMASINEMRSRQNELWTLLKKLAGDQGGLDQAYAGIPEELQSIIDSGKQGVEDVGSFNLDPKALEFLNSARDERINSIRGDLQDLFGSAVSDLAKRGMTSSS